MKDNDAASDSNDAERNRKRKNKAKKLEASRPKSSPQANWPPKMQLCDVEEVDTRRCLSMMRRVVRPPALPEVPDIPWGPFLN